MKQILSFFLIFSLHISSLFALSVDPYSFTDVTSSHENYEAIQFMVSENIVKGYEDNSFQPEKSINRAEFLKIVLESDTAFDFTEAQQCLLKSNIKPLSDVHPDYWYAPYVCYALVNNIIKGYPDGTFKAENEINLPEMAKIITHTQKLEMKAVSAGDEWFKPYIEAIAEKGAIPTSISHFEYKITRGEMAESLFRILNNKKDKPSQTFSDIKNALSKKNETMGEVSSCDSLNDIMIASQDYEPIMYQKMMRDDAVFEDFIEEAEAPTAGASNTSADDFSTTNIQVSGVDEADIIKNDGKYVYLIKGSTVRILEVYPADTMQELASFSVDDHSFSPTQLFLKEDLLIVIGNSYREEQLKSDSVFPKRFWGSSVTNVYLINVKDRTQPKITRSLSYEGNYSSSRRVGNLVYLIMNKTPDYHILRDLDMNAQETIPHFTDSAQNSSQFLPTCGCSDIDYFPGYERPNYLIISAIPLDDPEEEVSKKVFLGSSDTIYMSQKSIYVVTGALTPGQRYWSYDTTQIYKFTLNGKEIDFKATAQVPGRILNQFSLDEQKEYFRIATTKGEVWGQGEKSTNRLYVFDDKMERLGALENIAPGERIYSVRFMGDKAFLVTFKTVDPLFVITTKDPKNPQILGELKIPGWSDYLHPYDENHLIGFGKEVDENIDADKIHSDDAVYYTAVQGMKVSLFDVSDLKNPQEKFKVVIGDRGTESEILNNHKALLFDKEKKLLAFPVTVKEKIIKEKDQCENFSYSSCPDTCDKYCISSVCSESGICTADCDGANSCRIRNHSDEFQTTFSGAIVYNIDLVQGFSERGRISNLDASELGSGYYSQNWQKTIQRIIYMGKNLYTISQNMIKAVDIETIKSKGELEIK